MIKKNTLLIIIMLVVTGCHWHVELAFCMDDTFSLPPSAIERLSKRAKQGDPAAAERLAWYHAVETGKINKVIEFFRIAAESGDVINQYNVAGYLLRSSNLKERQEGVYWYEISAENGFHSSQLTLAELYESGNVVKKNCREAKKWYEKAALSGESSSMRKLSKYYEEGRCVNRDNIKAYAWLLAAEKQIHPDSRIGKRIAKKKDVFEKELSDHERKKAEDECDKLVKCIEKNRWVEPYSDPESMKKYWENWVKMGEE
jgi:TPR repeat protein